jgi:hypothetical protein
MADEEQVQREYDHVGMLDALLCRFRPAHEMSSWNTNSTQRYMLGKLEHVITMILQLASKRFSSENIY